MDKKKLFILIKPSASRYLDLIDHELRQDKFQIAESYFVDNWASLDNKLHSYELKQRSKLFTENYHVVIWLENYLFGNNALLLRLYNEDANSLRELISKTYKFKMKIRNMLDATLDGTCALIVDINKLNIPNKIEGDNGFLKLEKDGEITEFDDLFPQKGRYRSFFLNYLHSPDDSLESFERETKVLEIANIMVDSNRMTPKQYVQCKKMRSMRRS